MASMVGRMSLTNSSKEQIALQSGNVLVELLRKKSRGRSAGLQALYNLQDAELNELAAATIATIANIVSNPGHWELASADKKGHSMQSKLIVPSLLSLLSIASPLCQVSILRILCGIASSPQAAVVDHIKSGDGIQCIIPYLEHSEVEQRVHAFRLTRLLSERFNQDLACELKLFDKLSLFKDKVLDNQSTDGERSDAACIVASLPLSDEEVEELFEPGFVRWIVITLKISSVVAPMEELCNLY
ncbi:hypothetical protein LWI28_009448 [Acer negundo]|uniref:Uncharacterized protein n=1 Tax=Acer negundo TaxID=4023 RepID=A0AAD5JCY9_ACENE|nr:hypothetical protein LWI28_009448 [Acer negundo]